MPLSDALSAACSCCMLSDKYRMVSSSLRSAQSQDPLDLVSPFIGVCLPSFAIYAGASLFAIKSLACCLIVSRSRLQTRSLLLLRRVVHWTTATFFIYVINIFLLQMKTASELGIIQSIKQLLIPFIIRHIITTNRMVSWFLNFDINVSHNILSAYSHL